MRAVFRETWPIPDLGLAGGAADLQLCAEDTFAVPTPSSAVWNVSQTCYTHLPSSSPLVSEMEQAGNSVLQACDGCDLLIALNFPVLCPAGAC